MKFQNPSLNSVLTGRTDGRTHKPKPICSPLFQSWGHKNVKYLNERNDTEGSKISSCAGLKIFSGKKGRVLALEQEGSDKILPFQNQYSGKSRGFWNPGRHTSICM